jgi:FlaA1/EpsC-like NDP-sugar epimerase
MIALMKIKFVHFLITLPRYFKRLISIAYDFLISLISTYIFLAFDGLGGKHVLTSQIFFIALLIASLQIAALWSSGTYQTVTRFLGLKSLASSSLFLLISNAIIFAIFSLYGVNGMPNSLGISQPALFFCFFLASRYSLAALLTGRKSNASIVLNKARVALIYGAGDAGRQLSIALLLSNDTDLVGFIDDDVTLHDAVIQSLRVYPPSETPNLIKKHEVTHVLLALPSVNRANKLQIIQSISSFGVKVLTLPSLSELAQGNIAFSDLKELQIEDLITREITRPNELLLNKNTHNQVVLVTGAGGSIGSELCRQILKRNPQKLILVEMSEAALYQIETELTEYLEHNNSSSLVVSRLCNVRDASSIDLIIQQEKPHTIYHAGAYKHVPLVEINICEGILNNVQGTLNCINSAIAHKANQFIFISTDKAVRPTNVMGASKRLAEMILQGKAQSQKTTKISIVRFGNVLGSSGSVVPRFRRQIESGGPITLTHPEVTRFFMTIPEATQLVMHAGAMGGNGEVFLLNMGEPVKIFELAKRMIELSGLKLKSGKNQGDIEIKITGLRPGEKLFEELLIDDQPLSTDHPDIFMGKEKFLPEKLLMPMVEELTALCKEGNASESFRLLNSLILTNYSKEVLAQFNVASGELISADSSFKK